MESRESMMPVVETIAPEAPSIYQLTLKTDNPTQTGNTSQTMVPLGFSSVAGGIPSSMAKKKRGRPRKYGPDGVGPGGRMLSPMHHSSASSPTSGGYSDMKFGEPTGSGGEFQSEKKKRKKNSSEKSNMSLGDRISSGGSFTPHMVTVNPGEDVTSKIISFSKYGPRAICVLSALGIISHVTLRQASSSGGTVTYEGRFEILSLSGSFTPGEVDGISSREGGMSIALSSPDGRVVGGLLGGLLTAAGPVQVEQEDMKLESATNPVEFRVEEVVVASFLPDIGTPVGPKPRKQKTVIKLTSPRTDATISAPSITNTEPQNFNAQRQESPTSENDNSTPVPTVKHENHNRMPPMHDWRKVAADMNVSLREDGTRDSF